MNAYRTFDVRVRVAARAATASDRLLPLAEDLAEAVLSPGRFPKRTLTADERRAFLVEKLLGGTLGRRLGLTRALLFLVAGSDPEAPGVFFLPVAARRVEASAAARDVRCPGPRPATWRSTPWYAGKSAAAKDACARSWRGPSSAAPVVPRPASRPLDRTGGAPNSHSPPTTPTIAPRRPYRYEAAPKESARWGRIGFNVCCP